MIHTSLFIENCKNQNNCKKINKTLSIKNKVDL